MLPSGNDAATALSEAIGILLFYESENNYENIVKATLILTKIKKKGEENLTFEEKIRFFLKEMNKLSHEIGLERTNFASVHGLINSKNVSTARDIGLLACFTMKIQLF